MVMFCTALLLAFGLGCALQVKVDDAKPLAAVRGAGVLMMAIGLALLLATAAGCSGLELAQDAGELDAAELADAGMVDAELADAQAVSDAQPPADARYINGVRVCADSENPCLCAEDECAAPCWCDTAEEWCDPPRCEP